MNKLGILKKVILVVAIIVMGIVQLGQEGVVSGGKYRGRALIVKGGFCWQENIEWLDNELGMLGWGVVDTEVLNWDVHIKFDSLVGILESCYGDGYDFIVYYMCREFLYVNGDGDYVVGLCINRGGRSRGIYMSNHLWGDLGCERILFYHELGHWLGMGHCYEVGCYMNSTIGEYSEFGNKGFCVHCDSLYRELMGGDGDIGDEGDIWMGIRIVIDIVRGVIRI